MFIPHYEPTFQKVVAPELLEIIRSHGGEFLKDILPDYYFAPDEESNKLVKVYESHGVKVHRPRLIRPEETAYSFGFGSNNIFPCDAFRCAGRNVIESSWQKLFGRPQRWAVREFYLPRVDADPSVHLHACPMP